MATDKPYHLKIGEDFLPVADTLVKHGDVDTLDALGDALVTLILANLAGEDVSLIELTEYIGEAIDLLKTGRSPSDVKASPIRKLLDER